MAAAKAPVYTEKDFVCDSDLLKQLYEAVAELEEKMKATLPIKKGNSSGSRTIGFGVNKAQKGIAADSVISVARAIKSLKGW